MPSFNPPDNARREAAPRRQLTLLDSTSIIVGIIIGSAIYEMTPTIARCVPNAAWLVGVWVIGGLLSLVGAVCYAELATAYPREGGDYVYLTRAFGQTAGFLFAWAQFWIVRPGSIGALAYVFARYANELWPLGDEKQALVIYAAGSIVILSGINILGVREGKWTQNFLTAVKVVGLAGVVVAGLCFAAPPALVAAAAGPEKSDFRLALILVLFAYGGWNEMAYVGAEVRRPEKNILRALLLGTAAVTLLYVAVNLAFVHALGFSGTRHATAVAADVLELALGPWGRWLISLLVCISAPGVHQRHDLHRGADLLRHGDRTSPLCLAGPLEPTLADAGLVAGDPGGGDAAVGRRFRAEPERFGVEAKWFREDGEFHHAGVLDILFFGGRDAFRAPPPRAGHAAALSRALVSARAAGVLSLQPVHGLFQHFLGLRKPDIRGPVVGGDSDRGRGGELLRQILQRRGEGPVGAGRLWYNYPEAMKTPRDRCRCEIFPASC